MKKQYPATAFNLVNFLNDIEAHSASLRSKIISAHFISADNVVEVNLQGTITSQDDDDIESIIGSHNSQPESPFKIMGLINPDFRGFPIENIDFKRHLRKDIALNKKVTMLPNGRPDKSQYYNGEDLICEIRFSFETENYLVTDRKEHLHQVREDGSYSEGFLIKHKIYDLTDLKDGSDAVQERIDARQEIVSSMKSFLSGVIMQALGQTIDQVIVTITPFWDETKVDRDKFIEFGTDEWKGDIANIDLATTAHTYLAIPIDQNGTTVKDYMIGRLTY